jgi:hypothetical protein
LKSAEPDELTAFLLSRQHKIGWDEQRRLWLDAVEQLYQKITGELLGEAIAQKLVSVSRADKEIEEEDLGTYRIQELILDINGEKVRFSPKGRNIIGTKGRVDLLGELDSMTLLLEANGDWRIVVSRVPREELSLNRKTLTEALQRVMR